MSDWNDKHYLICSVDDVDEHLANPACLTTNPRQSLDGLLCIIKLTEPVEGSIDHETAFNTMSTAAWSPNA
jgi:hypothetical protein